jgi:hypothetical protein
MDHHDPLMMGMFWGGLLVASVPILLTLGIGIYVLRRYLESRAAGLPGPRVAEGDTGPHDRGGRE